MRGKVNPTQCEVMTMVAVQIYSNNAAVAFAGSQGHLELNVFKPLIIYNFLNSLTLISDACRCFIDYMINDTRVDRSTINRCVKNSLMLVTVLTPKIGHDKAAKIANKYGLRKRILTSGKHV